MKIRFEDDGLRRLWKDATYGGRLPQGVVKSYRRVVQFIDNATDERDLRSWRSWHFERYQSKPGHFSIRLNDQFRLILRFEGESETKVAVIVEITDYH